MDGFLIKEIDLAIRRAGCVPHRMVSGAGHDAMILAEKVPAAMVFLRTPGGISHDPAESVIAEMSTRPSNVDCTFSISWRRRPYFRKGRTVHNLGQTRSSHQHIISC